MYNRHKNASVIVKNGSCASSTMSTSDGNTRE